MGDDCRQVLHELQRYLDGETSGDIHEIMARHLSACPPCFDRAEFQREVRLLIASKCTEHAPPGLMDRVRSRLWPSA